MHVTTLTLFLVVGSMLETVTLMPQRTEDKLPLRCSEESRKRFKMEAVRIGGDIKPPQKPVKPPKKLADAQPEFPKLPPRTTISSGIWIGEALIAADGSVADAWSVREPRLTPPFPEFNEAILKAIRKWEYEPVTVEGERMPFCMVITVNIDFQ
jgi:outer membrane biosynthesis protein TonB